MPLDPQDPKTLQEEAERKKRLEEEARLLREAKAKEEEAQKEKRRKLAREAARQNLERATRELAAVTLELGRTAQEDEELAREGRITAAKLEGGVVRKRSADSPQTSGIAAHIEEDKDAIRKLEGETALLEQKVEGMKHAKSQAQVRRADTEEKQKKELVATRAEEEKMLAEIKRLQHELSLLRAKEASEEQEARRGRAGFDLEEGRGKYDPAELIEEVRKKERRRDELAAEVQKLEEERERMRQEARRAELARESETRAEEQEVSRLSQRRLVFSVKKQQLLARKSQLESEKRSAEEALRRAE